MAGMDGITEAALRLERSRRAGFAAAVEMVRDARRGPIGPLARWARENADAVAGRGRAAGRRAAVGGMLLPLLFALALSIWALWRLS